MEKFIEENLAIISSTKDSKSDNIVDAYENKTGQNSNQNNTFNTAILFLEKEEERIKETLNNLKGYFEYLTEKQ